MVQTFKPPAAQRVYDVCVIGSQLGGAVAGALLARRGYRVVHVDHDGLGTSYEDGGYLLPYAPAVLASPRVFPAADAALAELGLTTDLTRQLEPSAPDLQLLLPRQRVDLLRDPAARFHELRREFGQDAQALDEALQNLARTFDATTPFMKSAPPLPPSGFMERREVSKAAKLAAQAPISTGHIDDIAPLEGLEDHPFGRALRIASSFFSFLDGPPAPLTIARLLGGALRGTYRLPGGYEALREAIRRKITESRGELLGGDGTSAIAEAIDVDGGRIEAIRIAGSPSPYVAKVYIAATDAPALKRLLGETARESRIALMLDEVRPSRQVLALNLVVKAAALPPALGDSVLALPHGAEGEEGAVLFQVLPARRDGKKGQGEPVADERVICAATAVPVEARNKGDGYIGELAKRIKSTVADALPFFEQHVVRESVPVVNAKKAGRGSRLMPHPLYAVARDQVFGVTGLPCRSPLKNLVFAGREVVPGLGIEGEFHAGMQAATAAGELLGKRELLR